MPDGWRTSTSTTPRSASTSGTTGRRHHLAVRAGRIRQRARLPRDRRGRAAVARRRPRRRHGRAEPHPPRRPAPAAAGVAGAHPPGTNASVLEHLLSATRRSAGARPLPHRDLADAPGRLQLHLGARSTRIASQSRRALRARRPAPATGIRFLPVEHAGNASQSREEAEVVPRGSSGCSRRPYTDANGVTRPLVRDRHHGRLAVQRPGAPAESVLPDGVPIGTVDAFQGQEAPVVIFSMATSTGEDAPRDIGFLFSRNRLNVAISRARCLANLVLLAGAAGDEGAHDRGHAADLDAVRAGRGS